MKLLTHSLVRIATALACVLPLAACATKPLEPIRGQVLEERTNKPIPNAIVVARWTEHRSVSIADGQTVCVHVESADTDDQGRYTLPRYKDKEPTLTDSYKTGYARSDQYYQTRSYIKHVDILKPFTRTREERFQALWRIISATGCDAAGRSQKNLYPLYKAIYEEAKPLVTTEEEKQRLRLIREIAAGAWVAQDTHITTRESKKLIEEHLRDHLQ